MSYDGLFVFYLFFVSSFLNYFIYFKFLLIFSVKMTVLSEIFALSIKKKLHWINIFIHKLLFFFRSMRLHSCSVGISISGVNSWGKKEVKEGFRDLAWTQNQNGGVSPHQKQIPSEDLDAKGVLFRRMQKWCEEITFKHPHLDNPCFIFILKV